MKPEVGIELLVVILVVGRIVSALLLAGSGSLWYEAFSVVSLTIAALITEIRSHRDRLDHLKSRSCMSNGIVLGAITVPTLLSARLIQMQRCSRATGDQDQAIIDSKYGFSLAVACSMSMLFRVSSFARKQRRPSHWLGVSVLEFFCAVALFVAAVKQKSAWSGVDGVSWLAVYTLGGKVLFSYVVETFSYTGTIGEVMLAVQGIVLYGANALTAFSASAVKSGVEKPQDQGVINALLQALLLGLLAVPLLTKLIGNGLLSTVGGSRPQGRKDWFIRSRAGLFYLLLVLVVFAAVPLWVDFVTGVRRNPVVWCLQKRHRRFLYGNVTT
ncbi:hypothetical protein R1sor_024646 [Riccia sorocarpa]|uniref:dolichol kinase n=1 Tax=Riccia sorocarpa TaxID=122646 RepID=A0ABD3GR36_9MARC